MKKCWIGTGWKMNHLINDSIEYARSLKEFVLQDPPASEIFICVPYTALSAVAEIVEGSNIRVAAQNSHWLDHGALTGEISPLMVKDAGATMVEIGHSERREFFAETDEIVNLKVKAALAHDLIPLVCIGEKPQDKDYDVSVETIIRQIKIALHGLTEQQISRVIVAYEPVWAIGNSGTPALPTYADFIHQQIKKTIMYMAGHNFGEKVPILYGGSVNRNNAVSFISMPFIDGLFIGRSAWKVDSFISIIHEVEEYLHTNN